MQHRTKEAFLIRTLRGQDLPVDVVLTWDDTRFEQWFRQTYGNHVTSQFFDYGKEPAFREIGREYDLSKLDELRAEKEHGNVVVERLKPPRSALRNHVLHQEEVMLLEDIPKYRPYVQRIKSIIASLNYIGIYEQVTN